MPRYKCDFCSAPDPQWEYPAETFEHIGGRSLGNWAACTTCRDLIETGNMSQLAERGADSAAPDCPDAPRQWLVNASRSIHERFLQFRTGPVKPIEHDEN